MPELMKREIYPKEMSLEIERMGRIAVNIANRWVLGWPGRVKKLIEQGVYLQALREQREQELDANSGKSGYTSDGDGEGATGGAVAGVPDSGGLNHLFSLSGIPMVGYRTSGLTASAMFSVGLACTARRLNRRSIRGNGPQSSGATTMPLIAGLKFSVKVGH